MERTRTPEAVNGPRARRLIRFVQRICVLTGLVAMMPRAGAAATDLDLKAVFLFHFTQFVQWPESAFSSPDAPFVIGVVGRSPFGTLLESVVRGESVGHRKLEVRVVSDPGAVRNCQILYVPKENESLIAPRELRELPVLIVCESPAYYKEGATIEFILDRRHVQFRVNLSTARIESLTISAKLLRVAAGTDGGPVGFEIPRVEELLALGSRVQIAESAARDFSALEARCAEYCIGSVQEIFTDAR